MALIGVAYLVRGGGFGASVRVRQRQPGEPFALDLEVALTLRPGSLRAERVVNDCECLTEIGIATGWGR
ncbi:MAG TPA: hypothetical protein VK899_07695 [Gemmatimonadales bacterium]|nr:hypothetical protein [Gemmatimonadales bacterium]